LEESNCAVYCIQETKREHFDHSFIKKFAPKRYDQFAFSPSQALSGGIILGWNSSIFSGQIIHNLKYAVTVEFTSRHNNETWTLTTVYGPCQGHEREEFVNWLNNLQIQDTDNWMILGDFNFYRSLNDRNRPGGNINDVFVFNEIISNVGLQEIPLKGRKYTWSNMQDEPLLEQIDWCFTSTNWISQYPSTLLLPLSKPTSDHIPCMVQIDTTIPKADVFRFENFWVEQSDFLDIVQNAWNTEVRASNGVTKIAAKFKLLRRVLKKWSKSISRINNLITQCNDVLSVMDKLEEQRPLFIQEANFRKILRKYILQLLKFKQEYWKKRYTDRWTKFGDENTKFFHAAATERYRNNTITSLEAQDGRVAYDHFEKAALLLESFKARMGKSVDPQMHYNLDELINEREGFEHISAPFTKEEIDNAVKLVDKAPGPDGFNGMFFKKCWHIIKEDIYQLCDDFFSGSVSLQAINSSFITLIPKNNNPVTPNDFRPISLLNSILKLITKLMADRLQAIIIPLIHKNQYGFIKTRTIQDCLAWTFEYIHQCQQSKRELVILKLDFEKAFDTIEHDTILKMMEKIGFTETWIGWVEKILNSGSTSVMLNGIPGKQFQCKRGVRQGDPLSPLLFVLAADLLQHIVNKAHRQGIFSLPINADPSNNFPIIQYADDTILILKASQRELFCFKGLLQSFSDSAGLKVNYTKSQMIPLNLTQEQAVNLANTFGCQLGSLPFTYLGLPLGTTKPRVDDYMPLMDLELKMLQQANSFLLAFAHGQIKY
jgi:hypothetical protein